MEVPWECLVLSFFITEDTILWSLLLTPHIGFQFSADCFTWTVLYCFLSTLYTLQKVYELMIYTLHRVY